MRNLFGCLTFFERDCTFAKGPWKGMGAMQGIIVGVCAMLIAGGVSAQTDPVNSTPIAHTAATNEVVRVGMSVTEVLRHLGQEPDHSALVGAGCGMLEVLTWDEQATRLVAIDGVVSSVTRGKGQ